MKPTAYAFLLLTAALLLSSCGKSNDPAKTESQTDPATVPTMDGGNPTRGENFAVCKN